MRHTRARLFTVTAAVCAVALGIPVAPAMAEDGDNAEIRLDDGTDTPAEVSGLSDEVADDDPADAAIEHLTDNPGTYAIDDPAAELTEMETVQDGRQRTVRFAQTHQGLPVFGAQYLVHMTQTAGGQEITGATGKFFSALDVDATAGAAEDTAVDRAKEYVLAGLGGDWVTTADRPEVSAESHGLTVLPNGSGQLTYHVTVRTFDADAGLPVQREVFLDADAAFPVFDYSSIQFADVAGTGVTSNGQTVDLRLDSTETGYELRDTSRELSNGDITTWDARGYDVSWVLGNWPPDLAPYSSPDTHIDGDLTEAGAVDAHVNAGHVYDYYAGLGRDGLDDRGGAIDSLTGVTSFGQPFVNAFWDGQKMVYGGGGGDYYTLSADTDVVGHEMTHGVIDHSAGLVYSHQSGAMNEGLADYFGNAIDVEVSGTDMDHPDAGLLGEDLCRTASPRDCALRDLNDGATTGDYLAVTYDSDNGGVHYNSTIFAGALWDIREELGGELADRLVYKAMTQYMTPLDDFVDGRAAVESAAKAMRLSWSQRWQVSKAFLVHGIYRGWEWQLGLDGQELFGPLTTTRTGPSAKDGFWTTSNSDGEGIAPYQVFAGRTNGKGKPVQLSTDDGDETFHVYPVTDGEWVVWAAWGNSDIKIMRAKADGSGQAQEVHRTAGQLSRLTVDGDHIAWQMTDSRFGSKVYFLEVGGTAQAVDTNYYQNSYAPYIHDGKLLYLNRDMRKEHLQIEPVIRDLATDVNTVLPLPEYDTDRGIGWLPPVMTDDHVVAFADTVDGGTATLLRYPLDGSAPTVLIDETAKNAPIPGGVDATESAVSFSHWPGATVPKIQQISIDGGKVKQLSCSEGMQPMFNSDEKRRVVYFDGAAGYTALVTRSKPRSHC